MKTLNDPQDYLQNLPATDARTLVEASFQRVAPQADALVATFYERLFARAPEVRAMFHGDLREQKKKLIAALSLAVGHLRKPEILAPVLVGLGAKHAAYGVQEAHFAPVGGALLDALAASDPKFDEATKGAWAAVYGQIVELMTQGLRSAPTGHTPR